MAHVDQHNLTQGIFISKKENVCYHVLCRTSLLCFLCLMIFLLRCTIGNLKKNSQHTYSAEASPGRPWDDFRLRGPPLLYRTDHQCSEIQLTLSQS